MSQATRRPWYQGQHSDEAIEIWIMGGSGPTMLVAKIPRTFHPGEMDGNADLILAAVNACHALGVEPGELEARVGRLVEALLHLEYANKGRCLVCGYPGGVRKDGKHERACTLGAALAEWEGKP